MHLLMTDFCFQLFGKSKEFNEIMNIQPSESSFTLFDLTQEDDVICTDDIANNRTEDKNKTRVKMFILKNNLTHLFIFYLTVAEDIFIRGFAKTKSDLLNTVLTSIL